MAPFNLIQPCIGQPWIGVVEMLSQVRSDDFGVPAAGRVEGTTRRSIGQGG